MNCNIDVAKSRKNALNTIKLPFAILPQIVDVRKTLFCSFFFFYKKGCEPISMKLYTVVIRIYKNYFRNIKLPYTTRGTFRNNFHRLDKIAVRYTLNDWTVRFWSRNFEAVLNRHLSFEKLNSLNSDPTNLLIFLVGMYWHLNKVSVVTNIN